MIEKKNKEKSGKTGKGVYRNNDKMNPVNSM